MSRILILSSYYLGAASANGMCAKNIARELGKEGHEVFVLCYDKGEPVDNVFTVECPEEVTNTNLALKVFRRLLSFCVPRLNDRLVREYTTKAQWICKEKNVDIVVSMFFPLEAIPAIEALKKRLPQIRLVIYELDSVGDGIFSLKGQQWLVNNAIERWLHAHYRHADQIIVMESHEKYWKKVFGKKHGCKLHLADIPVLVKKELPHVNKNPNAPVSFLYGGLIEQKYRSPDHLLSVFEEYSQLQSATLDFFSKGDCEKKIADVAKRVSGIRQNGYVPEKVLDEAIARADVLVSIGNRVSRSVPSKLITYLSYGKPVVHISLQRNDVCAAYLDKYPLGLVLNEWDSVEENATKLREFVSRSMGKVVNFDAVASCLKKNTPAYSARLIVEE